MRILFTILLCFCLKFGFSQSLNSEPSKKISVQFGLGGYNTFGGDFNTLYLNGQKDEIDLIYTPIKNEIFNVFYGIGLKQFSYSLNHNIYTNETYFNYNSNVEYRGFGPLIGIRSSIGSNKVRFISNMVIESEFNISRSHETSGGGNSNFNGEYFNFKIDEEPALKKFNFSYHMQLGCELISKKNLSFHALVSGGRSLNSITETNGVYPKELPPVKVFPFEIGLIIGISYSL